MKIINKKIIIGSFISLTVLFFSLFFGLKTVSSDATVNFGINSIQGWFQSKGGDVRVESQDVFTNWLPGTPEDGQSCGGNSNAYVSLLGSGNTPGIVFSGEKDYDFGSGLASIMPAFGWVVGNNSTAAYNSQINRKTSYDFVYSKAIQGGLTPTDFKTICSDFQNCDLASVLGQSSSPFTNGLYVADTANSTLTLTGDEVNFPQNKNFVILVKGNLIISTNIVVPKGSTATFIVKGNITIDRTVGKTDITSNVSDIQGMYSADSDFIVDGYGDCAGNGPDKRLNMEGNVITGAGGVSGTFTNKRTLCDGDATCPSIFIDERPDFIINLPVLLRSNNYTWQEVAP